MLARREVIVTVAVIPGSKFRSGGAFNATRTVKVCVTGSALCATSLICPGNWSPGAALNSATICRISAERMSAAITVSGMSTAISISLMSWNMTTRSLARMFWPSSTKRWAITPSYGARNVESSSWRFASTTRFSRPRTSASLAQISSSRAIVPCSRVCWAAL